MADGHEGGAGAGVEVREETGVAKVEDKDMIDNGIRTVKPYLKLIYRAPILPSDELSL